MSVVDEEAFQSHCECHSDVARLSTRLERPVCKNCRDEVAAMENDKCQVFSIIYFISM